MADVLYFQTLPEDMVRNVVRHVSDCPRHPSWHRFTNANYIFNLLEVGGILEACVYSLFDGITTVPETIFRTGVIPEDARSWLFLRDDQQAKRLTLFVDKLNIHALELSRHVTLPITVKFLSALSKTITHLFFHDFVGSGTWLNERRIMKRFFSHLGPGLIHFEATVTNDAICWAISKYCSKLTTLRMQKIGSEKYPISLASFGSWSQLGGSVTSLAIQYGHVGCYDDAKLIQKSFINLRKFSVEFHPAAYLPNTRLLLEYYQGLERNQLEYSDLAAILGTSITVLARAHPNARFDACIISPRDSCAQFIGLGDTLKNVIFNAQGVNRDAIEAAVANCTRMENLFILFAIRAPMRSLHTLHLVCDKKQDVDIFEYVAKNTGRLECLTLRGFEPCTDMWAQIAEANKNLRRVRVTLRPTNNPVKSAASILDAFALCPKLNEIWVDVGDKYIGFTTKVRESLTQFRTRNTHVRVANVTYHA